MRKAMAFALSLLWPGWLLAGETSGAVELIAFVGRPVAFEEVECESHSTIAPQSGHELVSICMDAVYRMTYVVEEPIEGGLLPGSTVTFQASDHYGFPPFANQARALLYLGRVGDQLFHMKYQWDEVFRTANGVFSTCGCQAVTGEDDIPGASVQALACQEYHFVPAVAFDLRHLSTFGRKKYEDNSAMNVDGSWATCVRGVRSLEMVKARKPELLKELQRWSAR